MVIALGMFFFFFWEVTDFLLCAIKGHADILTNKNAEQEWGIIFTVINDDKYVSVLF